MPYKAHCTPAAFQLFFEKMAQAIHTEHSPIPSVRLTGKTLMSLRLGFRWAEILSRLPLRLTILGQGQISHLFTTAHTANLLPFPATHRSSFLRFRFHVAASVH